MQYFYVYTLVQYKTVTIQNRPNFKKNFTVYRMTGVVFCTGLWYFALAYGTLHRPMVLCTDLWYFALTIVNKLLGQSLLDRQFDQWRDKGKESHENRVN